MVVVQPRPLLPARPAVRVLLHEHVPRLREREGHHRERDPADAQAHRPEDERQREPEREDERDRRPEAPLPAGQRDRGHVDPRCDVERVAEREKAREPEQDVVGQCDPREEQAEREQLERSGAVERAVQDHGDVERELRHEREHDQHGGRDRDAERAPQCATFGASPPGRTRRMAASSRTTARSPVPLEL